MTFHAHHEGTGFVDLHHLGVANVIATAVIEFDGGLAIIDPGPTARLDTLKSGLQAGGYDLADVTHVLLTHIHLDHAGATGHILEEYPDKKVVVHERGAPHIVDPTKLMKSATRIFGDEMQTLWGNVHPVPRESMEIIGGDGLHDLANGRIEVVYTPGHASHHVSFFDTRFKVAYVGDTVGGRIANKDAIVPTTPPPDISLELIRSSVQKILDWKPDELFITHFGPIPDPGHHIDIMLSRLDAWSDRVRESLNQPGDDEERAADFVRHIGEELRELLTEDEALATEKGAPAGMSWYGLARYWRKKLDGETTVG
jgi:glyoxylase-like metal-dependent hydrolase (beta-lactamase superfamily II)